MGVRLGAGLTGRRALASLVAAVLVLGVTGGARAAITELGVAVAAAPPSCPGSPCLAVTQTTGYQAQAGRQKAPLRVPVAGRIVAWSITLSQPTAPQVAFFDSSQRGPARAGVVVLRPAPKQAFTVVAQSPLVALQPFFGATVQFPLDASLPVNAGDIVALSVPTWAAALAIGLGPSTAWRASRPRTACAATNIASTQPLGQTAPYACRYPTARLTYTATLIPTPQPAAPATPIAPVANSQPAPPRQLGR